MSTVISISIHLLIYSNYSSILFFQNLSKRSNSSLCIHVAVGWIQLNHNVRKRIFRNVRPPKNQISLRIREFWSESSLSAFRIAENANIFMRTTKTLNKLRGSARWFESSITRTYLYNFDPLKPHFYIVKLGLTGVYIIFLISAQKHRLWVPVRTASPRRF